MDFSARYNNLLSSMENYQSLSDHDLKILYEEAKETMDEYEQLQLVVKLNMNSLYGVSATIGYSLVDYDIAEDITGSARHYAVLVDIAINKFFTTWANDPENLEKVKKFVPNAIALANFKNYKRDSLDDLCIYGDTDSRYIDVYRIYTSLILVDDGNGNPVNMTFPPNTPEGNHEIAEFGVQLEKYFIAEIIANSIHNDIAKRGANDGYLKMALETISRKCVYQKKKKYIMSLIYKDGKVFDKPKLKLQGVEIKRGELSNKMKSIIQVLINKLILEDFTIDQIRGEIVKLFKYIKVKKDKSMIYRATSVSMKDIYKNDKGEWVSNKTHIQVKIAASWCNFIERNNLTDQYQRPFNGQKMNYYYDVTGNVIGVPDDVDMTTVPGLPEPDWNKMIKQTLVKPIMRYLFDENDFDDKDIDNFIMGIKKIEL